VLCIGFLVCLVVFFRRRKHGVTVTVPVAVMGLFAVRLALVLVSVVLLTGTFRALGGVPREQRAARLKQGIDEAMKPTRLGSAYELPILLAAWVVDGVLRIRQKRRRPRRQPPPAGALCPRDGAPATLVCARCGTFACGKCADAEGRLCATCSARGSGVSKASAALPT
jgi:hypothetical protein